MMEILDKNVPNFKPLSDWNKTIFLLTCENDLGNVVAKFLNHVLNTERPRLRINKELIAPSKRKKQNK